MSEDSVDWQLTISVLTFPSSICGRGPGCGGSFIWAKPGRDTHPFHLHSWVKLSHITTSHCHGKWYNYIPRKKRKAWILMSILISEKAESVLCKQETTRETISVSFPGSVSGWIGMEPYNDTSSSQVSSISGQPVRLSGAFVHSPTLLPVFISMPKAHAGRGAWKKGSLVSPSQIRQIHSQQKFWVQRKPLTSKNSLCKGH